MPGSPSMYDLELQAQADALDERKAILKQRAIEAAKQIGVYAPPSSPPPDAGWTSAVTGAHMLGIQPRTSPLAAAVPLVASGLNALDQSKLAEDKAVFNERARADAMRRLQEMPQGTPATEDTTPPVLDDEGNAYPVIKGKPATEPSLRDRLTWAAGLKANPMFSAVADKYIEDQLINAPDRAAKQAWERLKFQTEEEDKRLTRKETARHNSVTEGKPVAVPGVGLMDPVTRSVLPGTAPPDNYQFSGDMSQRASRRTGNVEPTGVTPKPAAGSGTFHETATPDPNKPGNVIWQNPGTGEQRSALPSKAPSEPKPLPATLATAWGNNTNTLGKLNAALAALATPAGQNATGWKGYIGSAGSLGNKLLNDYINPDGTVTRSLIQDISSLKLHDRSGAAVTLPEEVRQRFIPTITDDLPTVIKKLTLFKEEAEFHQQTLQESAEDQGYKVPVARNRTQGTPAKSPTAPASNVLPTTKEGHDAAVRAAQARVLKDNNAATRQALVSAEADRQNFIANGGVNKGSPGTNPGDNKTMKWGDLK